MIDRTLNMAYDKTAMEAQRDIREAGLHGKAAEAVGYLNECEMLMAQLREKLFGPFPQAGEANDAKRATEPSVCERLSWLCEHSAMMAGDLKNLLSRVE